MKESDSRLLSVDEAAKACGVSGKTIRNWMAKGYLPYRLEGPTKRVRIVSSVLHAVFGAENESAGSKA